jgi:hypothetical protein
MKTLDQIEPRTPISSLPFTFDKLGNPALGGNVSSITVDASDVTFDLAVRSNVTIRNGSGRVRIGSGIAADSFSSLIIKYTAAVKGTSAKDTTTTTHPSADFAHGPATAAR